MAMTNPNELTAFREVASLSAKAYRVIEEQIVTLQLAPGQVISETTLASGHGIGRMPVREALQQLAREGLVTILPRRGVIVTEIDIRGQLELLRVRREVERLMARLAANRASKNELKMFSSLAAGMHEAAASNDDIAFLVLDRQFNVLLAEACGNDYARRAMNLMQGLSRRFWYRHYKEVLDLPQCARLHADLALSIAKCDPEAAAEASGRLIDYLESFTRASADAQMPRRIPTSLS